MNFQGKSIFVWNDSVIGSPEEVAYGLVAANFEAALLHSTNVGNWRKASRVSLVASLQSAGIEVYASVAVYGDKARYGYSAAEEGREAAGIVNQYHLAGCVFDVEAGAFETATNAPALIRELFTAYRSATGKPSAFCGWAFYTSGGRTIHPVGVLIEAMKMADVGMPMAYWYNGSTPAAATATLESSWAQWRSYTNKPIIPAGRAYNDSYKAADGSTVSITARGDAIQAFDQRARTLGAPGITWWDMEHGIRITDAWRALSATAKFTNTTPDPDPEPEEPAMWNDNYALLAAFEKTPYGPEPVNIDFAALKAGGICGVLLPMGGASNISSYDDPYSQAIDHPRYKARLSAARSAGLAAFGAYDFSPTMDRLNMSGHWVLHHLNWLTSGNGKPDGIVLTCETNTWYESGKLVTVPAGNYKTELTAVRSGIWPAHKLVPAVRTGRWFIEKSGVDFGAVLDPVREDTAYLPVYWRFASRAVTDFRALLAELPDPTISTAKIPDGAGGVKEVNIQGHYLYTGNHTRWNGWEFAVVTHPAVTDGVGKPAPFRLIVWRGTEAQMRSFFNLSTVVEPSQEPDPEIDLAGVLAQVETLESGVSAMAESAANLLALTRQIKEQLLRLQE